MERFWRGFSVFPSFHKLSGFELIPIIRNSFSDFWFGINEFFPCGTRVGASKKAKSKRNFGLPGSNDRLEISARFYRLVGLIGDLKRITR